MCESSSESLSSGSGIVEAMSSESSSENDAGMPIGSLSIRAMASTKEARPGVLRVGEGSLGILDGDGILVIPGRGGEGGKAVFTAKSKLRRGEDGGLTWYDANRRWGVSEGGVAGGVSDERDRLCTGVAGALAIAVGGERETILRVGEAGDMGREEDNDLRAKGALVGDLAGEVAR